MNIKNILETMILILIKIILLLEEGMEVLGKILLDSEGYVCIRWEDEIGKLVSEYELQERAGEICDLICEDILDKIYE